MQQFDLQSLLAQNRRAMRLD
uniref:Uncharacterized protein n=1 Tax=Ralstonia syzygii R24 TaxID=907261 RepID=G3ACI6_9RALS|nr:hypothetical protein RALSY_mp30605 [Ralstonia syzygii R24]